MWFGLLAACGVILSVYLSTLSPSIAGGDSGEIVAEGCILGVAHPPGYPLLTILIYLVSLFQYETVAYRVNMLSAFLTTVACWCMGATVQLLSEAVLSTSSMSGSLLCMGMFAFSPLIWQYAVTAEVFPLNTMFASYLIYLTVVSSKYPESICSLLGAFICGLALGNQHTIILFEFPLILWILFLKRKCFYNQPMHLLHHVLLFLIGFSIYLYLPVVGYFRPQAGSWGHVSTIFGFLHHFLRKDYGTFQLFSGNRGRQTEGFFERNSSYFNDVLLTQGYYHSVFFFFVGIIGTLYYIYPCLANSIFRKRKKQIIKGIIVGQSAVVLLITFFFYFLVFHSLSNLPLDDPLLYGVHQRFWMQPNIIFFIFVGLGMNILASFSPFPLFTSKYLSMAVCLLLIYLQYTKWFSSSDQSDAYYFQNYANALLSPLPPNSLLLINYDMQWTSVRYMQMCEGLRPDVIVINLSMMTYSWFQYKRHLYPNISFPAGFHSYQDSSSVKSGLAFTLSQFVGANIDRMPIYLSGKLSFSDQLFHQLYEHVPIGLVSQILPKDQVPKVDVYTMSVIHSWEVVRASLPRFPPQDKYSELTWEWTIGRDTKDRLTDTAAYLLESALKVSASDYSPLVLAVYFLESALCYEGGVNSTLKYPSTALLKNAGLAHVNLIQNKLIPSSALPFPTRDIFSTIEHIGWPKNSWKLWSTERFLVTWGEFLRRPDAKLDPQYQIIVKMYELAISKKG